jgi:dTMP kinase
VLTVIKSFCIDDTFDLHWIDTQQGATAVFITFEGMDGSGKTTQLQQLAVTLRAHGYNVVTTREPGGTTLGDKVRSLLLDKDDASPMDKRAELLLFCASRAQLVHEVILPHLHQGGIVLCDRYVDSSLAYQGFGLGIDLDVLGTLLGFATDSLLPDLTLYMDISPEEGLRRRAAASLFGEEFNRIDDLDLEYHHRVYEGYQWIAEQAGKRWHRLDARQTPEQIQKQVLKAVEARMQAKHADVPPQSSKRRRSAQAKP